jgi:hypothetical protein
VLSLYDGKVYQGKIQVDDTAYSVLQNGGVLRFRKELVEGAFGSIREVYRFKSERVPARDPDERLKLARWCLSHHLTAEAKAQLLAVLDLSPGNVEIKNMVANIDNAETRAAMRDEALVRTRAVLPADGTPGELDPAIFRSGRAPLNSAAAGLPTIFDLPVPLAVKRADEFTRNVHPVLQRACARCHNEKYQGDFQLIEVKSRHDWTPNVARANLEAALRIVDPENLPRSELLSRSLVPHGPHKRPIFRGATDTEYQRVAAWVASLRRSPAVEHSASGRFGPAEPAPSPAAADSGGFATGRPRAASLPSPMPPVAPRDGRPQPPEATNPVTPLPPGQFVAGSGSGMQPYAPPDTDFTVPYMMGGPRPKPATAPGPAQAPPPGTAGVELPPLPAPTTPVAVSAPAAPAPVPAPAASAAQKPARKPVQIDPALLERALMNRYTTPQ